MSWLAAGASVLGGLIGYQGQREANNANREIASQATAANLASAREQMAFQERMSNTAMRRMKNDMIKAGFNPLLGLNGNGASTPAGASAQAATANMENPMSSISGSLGDAARMKLAVERQKEELENLKATNAKTKMETRVMQKNLPETEAKNILWEKVKQMWNSAAKDQQATQKIMQGSPKIQIGGSNK